MSAASPIERVEILQVNLPPKVVRTDAIQSFVTQETPIVRITCADGAQGVGYTYTIGTGGSSVVALLRDHLAPRLIGRDAAEIEAIWKDLFFATHATAVGAITSLALAAIDTALWDLKCRRARAAAVEDGRRRATAGAGVHDRRRVAAPFGAAAGRRSRSGEGARIQGRQGQGRQAFDRRGRRAVVRRARGGRRRVRGDGGRQPGVHGRPKRAGAPMPTGI